MDHISSDSTAVTPFGITLCHQKGGVGKSTTAAALGASFAELGRRVLVVDLDPSANLTSGLGFKAEQVEATAAEAILRGAPLAQLALPTAIPGLSLVPSGPDMLSLPRQLYERAGYEKLLWNAIHQDGVPYELILIDCPPMLDSMTIAALTAANLALIPTQCEYYSLQALGGLFKLIQLVRAKTNPQLSYRLLVTMFDQRGLFHTRMLDQIRQYYRPALLETVIGMDSKVRESQLSGQPVTTFAPKTRAAQQYRSLAQELQGYVQRQILQPA